jgi:hypothetical protein
MLSQKLRVRVRSKVHWIGARRHSARIAVVSNGTIAALVSGVPDGSGHGSDVECDQSMYRIKTYVSPWLHIVGGSLYAPTTMECDQTALCKIRFVHNSESGEM